MIDIKNPKIKETIYEDGSYAIHIYGRALRPRECFSTTAREMAEAMGEPGWVRADYRKGSPQQAVKSEIVKI